MSALGWLALVLSVLDTAFLLSLVALVKVIVSRPALAMPVMAGIVGSVTAAPAAPVPGHVDLSAFSAPRD